MALELERQTTVMFANVLGGAELTAKAGDEAAKRTLDSCLERLAKAAADCGARVKKLAADKLRVLVASADAAADTAAAMHTAMESFPQYSETKLALGIGFQYGPVIQEADDVSGVTVNIAAQLVERAGAGHIITTQDTAAHLSPLYRAWMRKLYSVDIKGLSQQVPLCELVWRADDNATLFAKKRVEARVSSAALTLTYHDKTLVRRRDKDAVTIGRDENCGIQIQDDQASRLHCTIERRQDKFVLVDHSTNGTYVGQSGAEEVLVQREEFVLSGRGTIACGQPAVSTKEIVQFTIE